MPSEVASGDVTLISRELARLGQNLAFLTSSRVRRTTSTGDNGPGSVLLRHVLRDCISTGGRGVARWNRSEPTTWPETAVTTVTVITASQPGPAIGFEGEGMARRGEISARSRPRAPHLTIGQAGCRGMAVGLVWGVTPDPSAGGSRGLWVPGGWASPEISNRNTQLVHI